AAFDRSEAGDGRQEGRDLLLDLVEGVAQQRDHLDPVHAVEELLEQALRRFLARALRGILYVLVDVLGVLDDVLDPLGLLLLPDLEATPAVGFEEELPPATAEFGERLDFFHRGGHVGVPDWIVGRSCGPTVPHVRRVFKRPRIAHAIRVTNERSVPSNPLRASGGPIALTPPRGPVR